MQLARTRPRIDWQTERERIDLAEVAINLLGPAKKREGRRLLWLCPFHDDHNPSFSVDPARKRWDCRPCGIGGDAAALVMRYERKTFPEALAYLTGGPTPTRKAPTSPAPKPKPKPPPDPSGLPEADALALVEDSAARLWTPEGADPLAYLTGPRFLTPETIRAARLGWTPRAELPTKDGRTWRASGVVIPYFTGPRLALVKIRQPDDRQPKYVEAFRDPARLVCYPRPATVRPGRPLVIVEGEFDALTLGEALGDMAAVVTLGSASGELTPAALATFRPAATWYVATDNDAAGEKSAERFPLRAQRVRPPGPYKDWTDARADGVNLARWWGEILAGNPKPALFVWEELKLWRWGDGDGTPGIDIHAPGVDE